jgi:hypothetical protein
MPTTWTRDLAGVRTLNETSGSASISLGVLTLDLSTATTFYVSLNASITTLTISNAQSTNTSAFTLIFTADGTPRSVTWGASIVWPGGTAPTLTSTNLKSDVFSFVTLNGGTTWYGFTGGQNF